MDQKFNQTEMRFIADLTAMVLNVIKNSKKYHRVAIMLSH
jgi:hypothetical protein